jgi:hypothetical protein
MGFLIWSGSKGWLPHAGAGLRRWDLAVRVFGLIILGVFGYAAFASFFKLPEQRRIWELFKKKVGMKGAEDSWVE